MNNDDERYIGLLGVYAEADRIRRGSMHKDLSVTAIIVSTLAVLFVIYLLVIGI